MFYKNNVKIVPENIYDLLDDQGLAFWIMDDGSLQNKGLHLNTYAFSERDINLLMEVLTNKFKLKCSIASLALACLGRGIRHIIIRKLNLEYIYGNKVCLYCEIT